jgi:hypothetical protein
MNIRKLIIAAACVAALGVCFEAAAQTRIRFATGRTSATVAGSVARYGARSYVLTARYGQVLSANVSSASDCVTFDNRATSTSYVTRSGNNYLRLVNSCGRTVSFTLTVSINYGSD